MFDRNSKKTQLIIVLATVFLDMLGFGLFLPFMPDLTAHFGQSEAWTLWVQAVLCMGMVVSGFFVGGLSDRYGRKNILILTTSLNLFSYGLMLFSLYFIPATALLAFCLYVGSRFIAGASMGGLGIVHAYISDISTDTNRVKNMGYVGAALGGALLIGPGAGGLLGSFGGVFFILWLAFILITINLLWIIFLLPEPKKCHKKLVMSEKILGKIPKIALILLGFSLFEMIGFSIMQSTSMQYALDKFTFGVDMRGYLMALMGGGAILFQGFCIPLFQKFLSTLQMFWSGLGILAIAMYLMILNHSAVFVFFLILLIPLGIALFTPAINSLLAKEGKEHAGYIMGLNSSMIGFGGIIGPLLVGWLYLINIEFPFLVAAILYTILLIFGYFFSRFLQKKKSS